jgi:hypothetical protein
MIDSKTPVTVLPVEVKISLLKKGSCINTLKTYGADERT